MLSKTKIRQTIKNALRESNFSGVFIIIIEGFPLINEEFLLLFVIPETIAKWIDEVPSEDEYSRICQAISLLSSSITLDSTLVWKGEPRYTLQASVSGSDFGSIILKIKKAFEELCKELSGCEDTEQDETLIIFAS